MKCVCKIPDAALPVALQVHSWAGWRLERTPVREQEILSCCDQVAPESTGFPKGLRV